MDPKKIEFFIKFKIDKRSNMIFELDATFNPPSGVHG